MRAQLILVLSVVLAALIAPALAGSGTVIIYGTNASNAQTNLTISDAPSRVNVTAWAVGGVKTFRVNVTNASDTLTFQLSNMTVNQVNELKINGTAINGYQADSNGNITFVRVQTTGNSTFNIAPAVNQGGFNYTWAWFTNLIAPASGLTGVAPNTSLPASGMNYSSVRSIAIFYTRDMTAASQNISYTGAGFKPTSIDIEAIHNNSRDRSSSTINSDKTFVSLLSYNNGTLGSGGNSGNTTVYLQTAASTAQQAGIVSIDNDGITLNWVKTGLPTGTGYIKITYYR